LAAVEAVLVEAALVEAALVEAALGEAALVLVAAVPVVAAVPALIWCNVANRSWRKACKACPVAAAGAVAVAAAVEALGAALEPDAAAPDASPAVVPLPWDAANACSACSSAVTKVPELLPVDATPEPELPRSACSPPWPPRRAAA